MPSRLRALLLLALAAATCTAPPSRQAPVAKGGIMDLSTWNFKRDGTVPLRGEWILRYEELLGPSILRPRQAGRLRQHVAALPFDVSPDVSLHLTVTVGVAVLEDGMESFEDLLRRADRALYAARASGKNRIHMAPGEDPGTMGTTTRG